MYFLLACVVWPVAITCILAEMWLLMAVGVLWLVIPPWRPALSRAALHLLVLVKRAERSMGGYGRRW